MYKIYSLDKIKRKISDIKEIDSGFIELEEGKYFIIRKNKVFIGYALIENKEGKYRLCRIFIRPRYRYQSYGIKLLKFIINNCREKKIDTIVCETLEIKEFLKKVNFRDDGEKMVLSGILKENLRAKEGMRITTISIVQNLLLALMKIIGGIYGKSRALISDGINSMADIGTSIGILIGIYYSNQPADEEHPYGHEKIESIIGNIMGVLMLITAFELGKDSFLLLLKGEFDTKPQILTVVWAGISMIVKYYMYHSKLKIGKQTDNSALIADAMDSKSDVYSSGGVIIGILLAIFINPIFDIIVSFIVALLIFKEGISIIFETSNLILDKQDTEFLKEIEDYILENTDVNNVHNIYMRKSGNKVFLSFHIRVDKNMSVYDAHNLMDEIKESIKLDFENIENIIIHVDYFID